tara:strand:- start:835 stop:1614 length:780 start_codon:yes stop_codon:yes gene_type:complete
MSSVNWKEWVTSVRGAYSVRLKSAHLIREKEFLSSRADKMKRRPALPTGPLPARLEKSETGHNLNWPTPAARDVKGLSGKGRQERKGHPTDTLPNAVAVWPTPTAAEGSKIGSQANYGQVGLSNHPAIVGHPDREKLNKSGKSQELWGTPTAMSRPRSEETMEKCLKFRQSKGKNSVPLYLEEQVQQNWPTPIQTDSKDVPYQMSKGRKITRLMGKANGKLNPSWVEQLMGLPVGWTQLPTEWIASDCSATESSLIPVK